MAARKQKPDARDQLTEEQQAARDAGQDAPEPEPEKEPGKNDLQSDVIRNSQVIRRGTPVKDIEPPLEDDEKDRLKRLGVIAS
jgi:hypothetical protein